MIALYSLASSPPDFVVILEYTKHYPKVTSCLIESASGSSRLAKKSMGPIQPKVYIHTQVTFNHLIIENSHSLRLNAIKYTLAH